MQLWGGGIRSDYIRTDTISVLLWALQPPNRLCCELSLETGWRVEDCLKLTTDELRAAAQKKRHCITITEQKTGKRSTKYINSELLRQLLEQSGRLFVFEGRDDYRKHRSRQAVFYDLKKAARRFNLKMNLSPHSLRKNYAVYLREQGRSLEDIRKALNHDNLAVAMLYAFSDEMEKKYNKKR